MRAPSGMSSPAVGVGVAVAVPALVAGAHQLGDGAEGRRGGDDALADEGVAAHEGPLVVVERAGLVEDRVGDGHLAHVVQLGGHAHVVERLAFEAEVAADGLGELGHAAEMALEAGMALGKGAQQHVGALALGRGAAGVLVRVHALVGDEQRLARRSGASCGMATAP